MCQLDREWKSENIKSSNKIVPLIAINLIKCHLFKHSRYLFKR